MAQKKKVSAKKPAKKAKASPKKTLSLVPKLPLEVLARKNFDGTISIMRLDNDEFFYSLDGVAAEAWQMFDGKTSCEKIVAKLATKHKVSPAMVGKNMTDLIKRLHKEKLIETVSNA